MLGTVAGKADPANSLHCKPQITSRAAKSEFSDQSANIGLIFVDQMPFRL